MAVEIHLINEYLDAIAAWVELAHADTVAQPRYRSSRLNDATSEASSVAVTDSVGANSFPSSVEVTPAFEQSLDALSSVLTTREECARVVVTDGEYPQVETLCDANQVVEMVASIPSLVVTILLIEDRKDMERVLEYTVIRRAMLCGESLLIRNVGSRSVTSPNQSTNTTCWLIQLLRISKSSIRRKAVRYLKIVSDISLTDWIGAPPESKPRQEDIDEYSRQRSALFNEICQLKKLIPLLLTLSREDVERACTTDVMQRDLDATLHRPFCVTLVFFDLCAHVITPVLYSALYTNPSKRFDTGQPGFYVEMGFGFFLLMMAYLVLRILSAPVAIWVMSWRVFRKNILTLWTLLNLLSVAMVLASYFGYSSLASRPRYTTFLAVSKLLLWLRLLAFLKVVKKDLSTFIMTIVEVAIDIRWFVLVIILVIVAFSDMMFTIITGSDGCATGTETCAEVNSFCKSWLQSMLEVYKVFVGDVGLDDYQQTPFTKLLFVLLTFFGVIILLTMLIAVVDESYERSRIYSDGVFGRARFQYVVVLIALESVLQPPRSIEGRPTCSLSSKKGWFRIVFLLLVTFLFCFFGFSIIIFLFVRDEIKGAEDSMMIAYIVVCVMLYAIACVLFTYLITGWGDAAQPSTCFRTIQNNLAFKFGVSIVTFVVGLLLGSSSGNILCVGSDEERVWHGRLRFIEENTRRIVHEAECRAGQKFDDMDGRLTVNRNDLNVTIAALENKVATINDRVSAIDARTKSMNESIMALEQLLRDALATSKAGES